MVAGGLTFFAVFLAVLMDLLKETSSIDVASHVSGLGPRPATASKKTRTHSVIGGDSDSYEMIYYVKCYEISHYSLIKQMGGGLINFHLNFADLLCKRLATMFNS